MGFGFSDFVWKIKQVLMYNSNNTADGCNSGIFECFDIVGGIKLGTLYLISITLYQFIYIHALFYEGL